MHECHEDANAQGGADEADQRGSTPDDQAQNDSLTEGEAADAGCGLGGSRSGWRCADFAHVAIVMRGSTEAKALDRTLDSGRHRWQRSSARPPKIRGVL